MEFMELTLQVFEFDGDSNEFEFSMDTTGLNGADYIDFNVDVTGSSNVFDIDLAELSAADYTDLDLIILGDSNELHGILIQNTIQLMLIFLEIQTQWN